MTTQTAARRMPPAAPTDPPRAAPRERILAAARELFYRHGLHAVGVEAIAEAAATNKMTLYRHFASKDELIAACVQQIADELDAAWDAVAQAHTGDPRGQLTAWLRHVAAFKLSGVERGCALVNAAIELPDALHPARRVIAEHKRLYREKIVNLCRDAGLAEPERLADELFLLSEGARVCLQSIGPDGPSARLDELMQALIADHAARTSPANLRT